MCVLKFWERVASLRIIYVIEQRKRSLNDVTICWAAYVQTRHVREPPLPLYIGLNIHTTIRSKSLITKLYQMGLCVSYDRVLEVEDWLATSAS